MMSNENEPTEIEDAILGGILKTMGLSVTGHVNANGRVLFHVSGDYEGTLRRVYANAPIGASDTLQNIKLLRQMIFALKNQGYGKEYEHAKHRST